MTNYDYWRPALTAVLLAVLYPLYWILEFTAGGNFPPDDFAEYMRWSPLDWLFVVVGCLSIYLYLSLRKILTEQLNYTGIDIPLLILVAVTVVFFFGLSISQGVLLLSAGDSVAAYEDIAEVVGVTVLVGTIIISGVAEILIGCLLLRDSNQMPAPIKIFAIITLIMGIFDLTVIFSFISLFIYPVSMLVLATYFLSKPEMIEVV